MCMCVSTTLMHSWRDSSGSMQRPCCSHLAGLISRAANAGCCQLRSISGSAPSSQPPHAELHHAATRPANTQPACPGGTGTHPRRPRPLQNTPISNIGNRPRNFSSRSSDTGHLIQHSSIGLFISLHIWIKFNNNHEKQIC